MTERSNGNHPSEVHSKGNSPTNETKPPEHGLAVRNSNKQIVNYYEGPLIQTLRSETLDVLNYIRAAVRQPENNLRVKGPADVFNSA
ncbi:hypothetical protein A2870_04290 [Candidatus Curtissbacteria bacterium RIFCSPHIGHO2_01_FULL_41_11]|uniref:Uncharacterized protein n=1 Tax=Candidatus Curtissbacteria bacterium RIFCSPHIGHO2_01_FULL_41_11 TaxID=1797711 RepID=A0A1F5G515_9BACT|nr:MAG: hypothetical protein A2870_04290 [Candidatus Curtissbacteria bacterium RIFCSPHIGHO2_01_FULL_41_11]